MKRILAVTSSTAVVGVAAASSVDGGPVQVVASEQITTDRRHAEELTPMIASVLADAGWSVGGVDAFAVDIGPGRFTGLRVGLATVRSLALAVDAPVVGITSLELLAAEHPGAVTAVVDARRSEVFQQRFVDGVAAGQALAEVEPLYLRDADVQINIKTRHNS